MQKKSIQWPDHSPGLPWQGRNTKYQDIVPINFTIKNLVNTLPFLKVFYFFLLLNGLDGKCLCGFGTLQPMSQIGQKQAGCGCFVSVWIRGLWSWRESRVKQYEGRYRRLITVWPQASTAIHYRCTILLRHDAASAWEKPSPVFMPLYSSCQQRVDQKGVISLAHFPNKVQAVHWPGFDLDAAVWRPESVSGQEEIDAQLGHRWAAPTNRCHCPLLLVLVRHLKALSSCCWRWFAAGRWHFSSFRFRRISKLHSKQERPCPSVKSSRGTSL